uniref:Uncharacterized protein n=1 Tax=virus sp. ctQ5V6 TaxID=2825815 RepID=A0A8S5RQ59_9VIRU|nr:MAG TPA: hypothetical protein [virus sp. ctQ5V6]
MVYIRLRYLHPYFLYHKNHEHFYTQLFLTQ